MRIAVTGSIASDHLMTFPGSFRKQIVEEDLEELSLSFLVDDLEIRRGGVAANISFSLAQLGMSPVLIGAVGEDFEDSYRPWLNRHGVETGAVRVSELKHTARALFTTDEHQNQIVSFYAGAMQEARFIELEPIFERFGDVELVVISPNDPEAMHRHTDECRQLGMPFLADPGQQLARLEGEQIRDLVEGATYLVTNEYERRLLENKTGWDGGDILERVDVRITTLGADGCLIEREGQPDIEVPAADTERKVDPTGVGDGFRAGLLAGLGWGLDLRRAAQVGSQAATYVLEHIGTQEHEIKPREFVERLAQAYGDEAAEEVRPHLGM